jgi:hypothetical protein
MWLSLQIKITFLHQHYVQERCVNDVHIALKRSHVLMLQVSALNITYPFKCDIPALFYK